MSAEQLPGDDERPVIHLSFLDTTDFTIEEVGKLEALRREVAMGQHNEQYESDLDRSRLLFVRWLVEHGKLGEG